ncbi:30S ribosomal protein S12 [Candidatus Hodgkinia cicadicola]|uniref:30S ribosomal protein S12 n=1 Tax=Candidatus Hodgkinia cicadicola TaxID=573658 RepID=A0ABX4MGK5_9HYPH|nr:30S ribosomal protein S12 [Candidatus Hodgkinia cicadicola]
MNNMIINQLVRLNQKKDYEMVIHLPWIKHTLKVECILEFMPITLKLKSAIKECNKLNYIISNKVMAYILREDYNLQEHSMVNVKGDNERLLGDRCHLFKGLLKLKRVDGRGFKI